MPAADEEEEPFLTFCRPPPGIVRLLYCSSFILKLITYCKVYLKNSLSIFQQVRCVNISLASLPSDIEFLTVLSLLIKLCLEFTVVFLTLLSHIGLIDGLGDVSLVSEVPFSSLILEGSEM